MLSSKNDNYRSTTNRSATSSTTTASLSSAESDSPFLRIELSHTVLRRSHVSVRYKPYNFANRKLSKDTEQLSRNAMRRALAVSRASRASIMVDTQAAATRLHELDEIMGLLKTKHAILLSREVAANEQFNHFSKSTQLSRSASRRVLASSRTSLASIKAKIEVSIARIDDLDEAIRRLRTKHALLQGRIVNADEQIGYTRDLLCQNHITEFSQSDDDDDSSDESYHHTYSTDKVHYPSSDLPAFDPSTSSDSDSDDYPITTAHISPAAYACELAVDSGYLKESSPPWDGHQMCSSSSSAVHHADVQEGQEDELEQRPVPGANLGELVGLGAARALLSLLDHALAQAPRQSNTDSVPVPGAFRNIDYDPSHPADQFRLPGMSGLQQASYLQQQASSSQQAFSQPQPSFPQQQMPPSRQDHSSQGHQYIDSPWQQPPPFSSYQAPYSYPPPPPLQDHYPAQHEAPDFSLPPLQYHDYSQYSGHPQASSSSPQYQDDAQPQTSGMQPPSHQYGNNTSPLYPNLYSPRPYSPEPDYIAPTNFLQPSGGNTAPQDIRLPEDTDELQDTSVSARAPTTTNIALAEGLMARAPSGQGPTAAASVPPNLMEFITPELLTRWESSGIVSSASSDVLAAHVAKRGNTARFPSPYDHSRPLLAESNAESTSSRRSSTSGRTTSFMSGSESSSMRTTDVGPSGVQRTIHSRHRGPPRRPAKKRMSPLSDNDKVNIAYACLCCIANMCGLDCWPTGTIKTRIIQEACDEANAAATREGRPTTVVDTFFRADVRHYESNWRTKMKKAIYAYFPHLGIGPSAQLIKDNEMEVADIQKYKANRVQELLLDHNFCDSELDDNGFPIMYSNPAFIQFVIDFFYGEQGIAAAMPTKFGARFPDAALVVVRTLFRHGLTCTKTGVYVSVDLHSGDGTTYAQDLALMALYTQVGTAFPRHKKAIRKAERDIAARGIAQYPQTTTATMTLRPIANPSDTYSHILPGPLPPGEVDSDSANDGEGDADTSL
ncbi:hypothetical protein HWV62_13209 [Athelia sp. TMB]|nr:hypothetical protein HWV62_13209 [Athelia sp. TMB]